MPAKLDRCVADLEGKINKKTGKPYTRSERFAICQAAMKKESKAEFVGEKEIALAASDMDAKMNACHQRMMKTGKAKNMEEAHQLCQKMLAKASNDIYRLEFLLDLEFLGDK
jgi:hypothetical protein